MKRLVYELALDVEAERKPGEIVDRLIDEPSVHSVTYERAANIVLVKIFVPASIQDLGIPVNLAGEPVLVDVSA